MTQVTYATIAEEVKGQCASEAQETLQENHTAKELRAVAIEIARSYVGWTTSEYYSMKKAELADAIVDELVRNDVCCKDSESQADAEVSALSEQQETGYAEVKTAYSEYLNTWSENERNGGYEHPDVVNAYNEYLRKLFEYRQSPMTERNEVIATLRAECGTGGYEAVEKLIKQSYARCVLEEFANKCGIHVRALTSTKDTAIRLLRTAGIDTDEETCLDFCMRRRKELQRVLREKWDKRQAIRKACKLLGADSYEAEIISKYWTSDDDAEVSDALWDYRQNSVRIARERVYDTEQAELERRRIA